MKKLNLLIMLCFIMILILHQAKPIYSQVSENEKRYIRIGSLQSHFTAYGSERAWNNVYYEGLAWPADYSYQDNAVIKRAWIAARDFTDANGYHWDYWGTYISKGYVGNSLYPMELKQTAKFEPPTVYVDGINITAPYAWDVDKINPDQIPDRIVTNIVNTTLGLTMTRRILAFSQQYHDNYFIKEFIFKNTGNVDYDEEIELCDSLKGVRIGCGTRYSVCREGAMKIDNQQIWGKHSWVTKRGEDYHLHANDHIPDDYTIVDWIRCGFSWFGQSERVSFDNVGAADINSDGRLCAPQHAGIAILHVDKSATDDSDDPNQPVALGWHAGDTYPSVGDISPSDSINILKLYNFLSGNPYPNENMGGTDRMDETYLSSITDPVDPYTIHGDGGGTNVWICYGPFDLAHGDSIIIVEAEGISGLSRQMCEEIGGRWKQAYDNPGDTGPFTLPDSSTTNNKDVFKNTWVCTGKDSILLTFSRAKRNYDMGYYIQQPPPPPSIFEVISFTDRITLLWNNSAESSPGFAGYKIYCAEGRYDTTFQEIFACGPGTDHPDVVNSYEDTDVTYGHDYYYYIVSFDDGSANNGIPL
ncbi:MAG: fibronectin [Candidatus Marinimicrobia bacterium]|nr:fibronectin [Candidatus Neomarinimicrobiota bacterium]